MLSGTRIGVYEIVTLLGAGGMGEVYRARDTQLQREVALKILPAAVAADLERLARFTREAQLLASLNHPNIASIHGLEGGGSPEGTAGAPAIVMELVEGPTLADRIAQGPIAIEEAVVIGRQIADAVEFAHDHGVIHRDLKPANIKLRADGSVKVLDFGLAKALATPGAMSGPPAELTQSPTLSHQGTAAGLILGTAAYMAPEQARGRVVDRRADVWAFGVVLYEMITGRRPFQGDTISDTLAAILKDPPDWSLLPLATPPEFRQLLRRMLEKDPRRRLRDIGDARLVLEDVESGRSPATAPAIIRTSPWLRALPWLFAIVAVAVGAPFLWLGLSTKPADLPALKYSLAIPDLQLERTLLPTLSPDGTRILFSRGGQLWVRELDKLDARPVPGVAGAQYPFWSPDGRQIAYLTTNAVWRVGLDGNPPIRVASYTFSKGGRTPGGVWRPDGTLIFAPAATGSGLFQVQAEGGEFREFFARNKEIESDFHRPSLLPDGKSLLIVVDRIPTGADTISVVSDGRQKQVLSLQGEYLDSPVYSPTGHLLYHRETTTPGIWAAPFSIDKLEVTGAPFLVVPQGSWPSIASNGMLLYADTELSGLEELVWFDLLSGGITPVSAEQFPAVLQPRLSPDGRHIAATVRSSESGMVVVVMDIARRTHTRLADNANNDTRPSWLDDRTVVYSVTAKGRDDIVAMRRADGSQPPRELFPGRSPSASPGHLFFVRLASGMGGGLWHGAVPSNGAPADPVALLQTPPHEWEPRLSPDGTLLAYNSGDVGQSEVLLRRYPDATEQWQVSRAGGTMPIWNRAGDTLYFRDPTGIIFAVDVRSGSDVTLSEPREIKRPSAIISRAGFDVSPDGKRLLMVREVRKDEGHGPSLAVVQNWFKEFKK